MVIKQNNVPEIHIEVLLVELFIALDETFVEKLLILLKAGTHFRRCTFSLTLSKSVIYALP